MLVDKRQTHFKLDAVWIPRTQHLRVSVPLSIQTQSFLGTHYSLPNFVPHPTEDKREEAQTLKNPSSLDETKLALLDEKQSLLMMYLGPAGLPHVLFCSAKPGTKSRGISATRDVLLGWSHMFWFCQSISTQWSQLWKRLFCTSSPSAIFFPAPKELCTSHLSTQRDTSHVNRLNRYHHKNHWRTGQPHLWKVLQ